MNSLLQRKSLVATSLLLSVVPVPSWADNGFNTTHPTAQSTIIADDSNSYGGGSYGTTHQLDNLFWAEKTINVDAAELKADREVRLRAFIYNVDYSYDNNVGKPQNGLDESFEVVVNGQPHVYRNNMPDLPSSDVPGSPLAYSWYDFVIPKEELKAGANKFIFRKAAADKYDDFFYVGIDNTVQNGHSRTSFDGGKTWSSEKLNVPGATGEFMVRLVFAPHDRETSTLWTPATTNDAGKLIGYAEVRDALPATKITKTVELSGETAIELQLNPSPIDQQRPIRAIVEYTGATPRLRWTNTSKRIVDTVPKLEEGKVSTLMPPRMRPTKLEVLAPEKGDSRVTSVRLEYTPAITDTPNPVVDMAPRVAAPKGSLVKRPAAVRLSSGSFEVENGALRARFTTSSGLRLVSLQNEYLRKNMLAQPALTRLFLLNINEKIYGAEDFKVASVKPLAGGRKGVAVRLSLPQEQMAATLTIAVDNQSALRLGLTISNIGKAEKKYKTAFPHLAGLQLSPQEKDDFYLFPLGGGIIASVPTSLRTTYGEQTAWWQMIDVFSPGGGAGVSVRADDATGLYKSPVLRKGTSAADGAVKTDTGFNMAAEMTWRSSLKPATGTSLTFEYQQAVLAPGKSAAVPDGIVDAHPGDWRVAMRRYSDWGHKTWKWRPYPSKLKNTWNMHVPGWGTLTLFKDGKYRTDYINDTKDTIELMSYWEWATVGPWRVPMDQIKEKLGERLYKDMEFYFVNDPATGIKKFNLNMGAYTGTYNESWGGRAALRAHIKKMQDLGKPVTLYTNPIVASDTTEVGHKYGKEYGVINPVWIDPYPSEYSPKGYITTTISWNMDPNTAWYQDYYPKMIKQLLQETGADGVRLDEYGHGGYVCLSDKHQHLIGQRGQNVWMQSACDMVEKIRAKMDELGPGRILSTEYPGIDRMAANLDQSLGYECALNLIPGVRPVPCNLFRFYFPEAKIYDLDNQNTPNGLDFRFWNTMGACSPEEYGLYPPRHHTVLKENSDTFEILRPEALVPTLASRIYGNRYTHGNKSITLLLNGREFTANEPMLDAPAVAGTHYFDLLNGREIRPKMVNGKPVIGMKLKSHEAACVARLPQRLQASSNGKGWTVSLRNMEKTPATGLVATLCTVEGEVLARQSIAAGKITFASTVKDADKAVCIKLMKGSELVDAIELPAL